MGDIHHLNTSADSQARLLEQWITETIAAYPQKEVAERWAEMARKTARLFPGPPAPSQPDVDLGSIDCLSAAEKDKVFTEINRFMVSYFDDVRQQLMLVHSELLQLQKTVAELEYQKKYPNSNCT